MNERCSVGGIRMEKHERPKLALPKTRFEIIFDCLTLCVLLVTLGYLVTIWKMLPAEVPAHYNIVGEVDRWGSKWEILVTPMIAILMWLGMTVLEKYPHVYNYLNLRKDNVAVQYLNARLLLHVIKNMFALLFAYVTWNDIQVALEKSESLSGYFPFVFLGAIFIPMIFFIARSLRH